jgi:hypothetical protein
MKNFTLTFIFGASLALSSCPWVFSAQLSIDGPSMTLGARQPIMVTVSLDTEGKTVSGISGNFSFPTDLFTVDSFILESSIVSPWVQQPALSVEKYLDNRTHITFEGIFPGGFSGVRSPYYQGLEKGKLFSIVLIPKNKGQGLFVIDDIILNEFSPEARALTVANVATSIIVPDAVGLGKSPYLDIKQIQSTTLATFITRNELVARNAWYLIVNDTSARSSVSDIFVAETNDISILSVAEASWRKVDSPYVLLYQNRSKYIHIKVVYSNKTYALVTLPPVENFQRISTTSRILVSIVVLIALLHHYRDKLYFFIRKKL